MTVAKAQDGYVFLYKPGQASTLIAVIIPALLSICGVTFVLLRGWIPMDCLRRDNSTGPSRERLFFNTQLGAYAASLLLGNLFSSFAFVGDVAWIMDKGVEQGVLCRSQAILTLLGNGANAYFAMAIAIHTFNTLVLRNRPAVWYCVAGVIIGWLIALSAGIIPAFVSTSNLGHILGPNGLTCGISIMYPDVSIGLLVVPVFFSALVMATFYILIFLVLRGTLSVRGGVKLNFDPRVRWSIRSNPESMEYQRFIASIARSMLWFPIAFLLLLLPRTVATLLAAYKMHVSFGFNVFGGACVALLGLANSVIIFSMLRILLPFLGAPPPRSRPRDMEGLLSPNSSPGSGSFKESGVLRSQTFNSSMEPGMRASVARSEYSQQTMQPGPAPDAGQQRGFFGGLFSTGSKSSSESTPPGPGRGATLKIPEAAVTKQRFGFGRSKGARRNSTIISPLIATLATVPLTESPVLPEVVGNSNRNSFFQLYSTKTPTPQDMSNLSSTGSWAQSRPINPPSIFPSSRSAGPVAQFPIPKPSMSQEETPHEEASRSVSPPTRLSAYMERAIRRPSVLDLANLMPEEPRVMPSIPVTSKATTKEGTVKASKSLDDLHSNERSRAAASTKASRRSKVIRSHSASSAIEIAGTLPHVTVRDGPSKGPTPPTTPSLRQRAPTTPTVVDSYEEPIPALPTSALKAKRRSQSLSSIALPPKLPTGLPPSITSSRSSEYSTSTFGTLPSNPRSLPGSPAHSRNGSAASSAWLPTPPRIPVGLPSSPAASRRSSVSSSTFTAHSRSASAASFVGLPPPPKISAGLPSGLSSSRSPPSRMPIRQAKSLSQAGATSMNSSAPSTVAAPMIRDGSFSAQLRTRQRPIPLSGAPDRAMMGLPSSPASIRNRDATTSPASASVDFRQAPAMRPAAQTSQPRIVTNSLRSRGPSTTDSDKRSRRQSRLPRPQNAMPSVRPRPSIEAVTSDAPLASLATRRQNGPAPQTVAAQSIASRDVSNPLAQRAKRRQSLRPPVASTRVQRSDVAPPPAKGYGYI